MLPFPTDSPTPSSAPLPLAADETLIDAAAAAQQRETDFTRLFAWNGNELQFTLASELYYRELRAHTNAPALGDYITQFDADAEAPRILYCAAFDAAALRALRLQSPARQVAAFDAWVEKEITLANFPQAAALAREIIDTIARARSVPQPGETDDADGLGNSPSRPSPATSSPMSPA